MKNREVNKRKTNPLRATCAFTMAITLLMTVLAGCGLTSSKSDRSDDSDANRIPEDARRMDEGMGLVKFTARADGMAYLYDVDDRRLIFERPIRRGQDIVVRPEEDRATIGGRTVFEDDL